MHRHRNTVLLRFGLIEVKAFQSVDRNNIGFFFECSRLPIGESLAFLPHFLLFFLVVCDKGPLSFDLRPDLTFRFY